MWFGRAIRIAALPFRRGVRGQRRRRMMFGVEMEVVCKGKRGEMGGGCAPRAMYDTLRHRVR